MIYKTMNLHMARPYPKRAAGVAMINALGGLSNIWASYLYYNPPRYFVAFGVCKSNPLFSHKYVEMDAVSPTQARYMLTNLFPVLGCATSFFLVLTGYLFYVRKMNRMLGGTPEEQAKVMAGGVTRQQVELGWRYIGY